MTKRVAKKIKQYNGTQIELMEEKWPMPNPLYDRIDQGLFLTVNQHGVSLYTPWGEKKNYGQWGRGNSLSLTFKVFKKAGIRLRFIKNIGEKVAKESSIFLDIILRELKSKFPKKNFINTRN